MKKRTLAGFGEVAIDQRLEQMIDEHQDKKTTESTKAEHQKNVDSLDKLLNQNVKNTTVKGFVLESEVAKAIDKLSRGKGRGFKSDFVNAALKKVLSEKGLL